MRNSWKTSGSLGGPAGGEGCWTTGIEVRPRRPRRERSRSRQMQRVGATRDGMSRARAHGPTIRGEKGAEAAGYEIMKITCHGEVNGWGRTLGISGAGQARHEGEEEKGTRNAHLSDASLDTELLARRENDRPNLTRPDILDSQAFRHLTAAGTINSSSHQFSVVVVTLLTLLTLLTSPLRSLATLGAPPRRASRRPPQPPPSPAARAPTSPAVSRTLPRPRGPPRRRARSPSAR